MEKNPINLPRRRSSNRLPEFDYSQPGAYFITICTHNKRNIFGEINENIVVLNALGKIIETEWFRTGELRATIEIFEDEFIIMPNHFHGILRILDVGATGPVARSNTKGTHPITLGTIIGQFKSQVSRKVNKIRGTPGRPVWQRNYYDHIIRNIKDLNNIRKYIEHNPYKYKP